MLSPLRFIYLDYSCLNLSLLLLNLRGSIVFLTISPYFRTLICKDISLLPIFPFIFIIKDALSRALHNFSLLSLAFLIWNRLLFWNIARINEGVLVISLSWSQAHSLGLLIFIHPNVAINIGVGSILVPYHDLPTPFILSHIHFPCPEMIVILTELSDGDFTTLTDYVLNRLIHSGDILWPLSTSSLTLTVSNIFEAPPSFKL